MPRTSAGLLIFRRRPAIERSVGLEVLLGHLGGPFYRRRDERAWTIPKGEYDEDEGPERAAAREFVEELGLSVPAGEWLPLGSVRQSGGKQVTAWAVEGDLDPDTITPGTFELEWPPRSGRRQEFPELDRVAWFGLDDVGARIITAQAVLLSRLRDAVTG